MAIIVVDGRITEAESLPMDDPAIQWGAAGFFETMRLEGSGINLFESHMRRIGRSLDLWRLDWPCDEATLLAAIAREAGRHAAGAALRLRVTIGPDPSHAPEANGRSPGRAIVQTSPLLADYLPPIPERRALRAATFRDFRLGSTHPLTGHKSSQFYLYWEAKRRVASRELDEAILLNERGEIVEACTANVFWIADGELFTPELSTGCLPGTMAAHILERAATWGLRARRIVATRESLDRAEAIFITNSGGEAQAFAEFDGRAFAPARAHPIARTLLERLEAERESRIDRRI